MADSRRWGAGGVRRDDQFTRAPGFRDGQDSAPLAEGASWHGSGRHHVAFAVGLAVVAGVAAVAFMVLSPSAPDLGSPASGAAAQGGDAGGPLQAPDGAAGNQTSLPTGLPTVPPAPSLPPLP